MLKEIRRIMRSAKASPRNRLIACILHVLLWPILLIPRLFWPRRSFRRYPGTILVEVLDPIAPGLSKQDFAAELQQRIETATARLVAEGERELARNGITTAAPVPSP